MINKKIKTISLALSTVFLLAGCASNKPNDEQIEKQKVEQAKAKKLAAEQKKNAIDYGGFGIQKKNKFYLAGIKDVPLGDITFNNVNPLKLSHEDYLRVAPEGSHTDESRDKILVVDATMNFNGTLLKRLGNDFIKDRYGINTDSHYNLANFIADAVYIYGDSHRYDNQRGALVSDVNYLDPHFNQLNPNTHLITDQKYAKLIDALKFSTQYYDINDFPNMKNQTVKFLIRVTYEHPDEKEDPAQTLRFTKNDGRQNSTTKSAVVLKIGDADAYAENIEKELAEQEEAKKRAEEEQKQKEAYELAQAQKKQEEKELKAKLKDSKKQTQDIKDKLRSNKDKK